MERMKKKFIKNQKFSKININCCIINLKKLNNNLFSKYNKQKVYKLK